MITISCSPFPAHLSPAYYLLPTFSHSPFSCSLSAAHLPPAHLPPLAFSQSPSSAHLIPIIPIAVMEKWYSILLLRYFYFQPKKKYYILYSDARLMRITMESLPTWSHPSHFLHPCSIWKYEIYSSSRICNCGKWNCCGNDDSFWGVDLKLQEHRTKTSMLPHVVFCHQIGIAL